jgi:acetoin utilization protein AcuC
MGKVALIGWTGLGPGGARPYLWTMTVHFFPKFIGSEIYRDSSYGSGHPLAIPRVSLTIDLIRALGWFPDGTYVDSPRAGMNYLTRFHTPDYVAALIDAEANQDAPDEIRKRHNIGINGNPIFPEMFKRPATAAGGGRLAAELVADGGAVYNLGGGQHHGRPDQASGFCYFNEPALTIGVLLEQGCERIFYLDIDAHHGDGVQDAFHDDDRVFTVSIHEGGRWPMSRKDQSASQVGGLHDRAGGMARNIPVPPELNDDEFEAIIDGAVLPSISDFSPDAIFVQCGADALADDPQSKLALSNHALWRAVARVSDLSPRLIVSGGGGYNPFSLARCWAGVWGTMAGFEIPDYLPDDAQQLLRDVTWTHRRGRTPPDHWYTTLADPPHHGQIRSEVKDVIKATLMP